MFTRTLQVSLPFLALFTVWSLTGCGKIYNSASTDSRKYALGSSTGSATFLAAKAVINQQCTTCHTRSSHADWTNMSEQDFIAEGLVTPGSLENSSLYNKIKGNRTSIPGNMPLFAPDMSVEDLTTLENWIMGM